MFQRLFKTTLVSSMFLVFAGIEPSWAALNIYVFINDIPGSVTRQGREGSIEVFGFNHEVNLSLDSTTSTRIGRREHQPMTFVKAIDKSSPLLMDALVKNRTFNATIRFYRPSSTGLEEHYYTIQLTQARVVSVKTVMLNNEEDAYTSFPVMEEVSLIYREIEWTWVPDGITTSDNVINAE